jgi:hypothetical protein
MPVFFLFSGDVRAPAFRLFSGVEFGRKMGAKLGVKWAQIEGCQVSKGSRINRDFADFWSGRWESNPHPKLVRASPDQGQFQWHFVL